MQRYDEKSGLVYKESIVKAQSLPHRWIHRRRVGLFTNTKSEKYRDPRTRRSELGARSLYETARLSVLTNLPWIQPAALRAVPELIIEDVWEALSKGECDSVHAWQLFRTSHPHSTKVPLLYHADTERSLVGSLETFLQPTWNVQFECVTSLDLIDKQCTVPELVWLPNLPNLVALCVKQEFSTVIINKVLRAWGESAQSQGGFARLRTLQLGLATSEFEAATQYMKSLPVLEWLALGPVRAKTVHYEGWMRSSPFASLEYVDERAEIWDKKVNMAQKIYEHCHHTCQEPRIPMLSVRFIPRQLYPTFCLRRDRSLTSAVKDVGIENLSKRRKVSTRVASSQQVSDSLKDFGC